MGFTVHIQLSEPIHFSVREGISSLLARDECRIENFTTTFPKRLRKSSRSSDILQLPFENHQNRSAGPERGFLNPLHLLRRGELMPGAVRASISIPLLPDLRSHNHLGQGWHSLEGTRQRGERNVPPGMSSRLAMLPLEHVTELQPMPQRRDSKLTSGTWHEAPERWRIFQPHFLSQNELVSKCIGA